MNKYKNRNNCDFFSGSCLVRIYEISNDDLLQLFEIVLCNKKRYTLRKDYTEKEFTLYYNNDRIFYFKTAMEAVAYIINSNDIFEL